MAVRILLKFSSNSVLSFHWIPTGRVCQTLSKLPKMPKLSDALRCLKLSVDIPPGGDGSLFFLTFLQGNLPGKEDDGSDSESESEGKK